MNTGKIDQNAFDVYCLYAKSERLNLLKRLVETQTTLRIAFEDAFFLSTGLSVSDTVFFLKSPQDKALRDFFTDANNVLVETELDKITIEWRVAQLFPAVYDNSLAFRFDLPEKILRLQRRETFRVAMQGVSTAFCNFMHATRSFSFAVKNLSVGGLALESDVPAAFFSQGDVIEKAELFLPQTPPLTVALQIKGIREEIVGVRKKLKLGCTFTHLSGQTENQIARCIAQLERAALRR